MNILDLAKEINKELGIKEGGVQVLGKSKALDIERLKVGSLTYDIGSGGGYKVGAHTILQGPPSSGKTTSALLAAASYQQKGDKRPILYIDSENSLDKKYSKVLGLNIDQVLVLQPDCLEDGAEVIKKAITENLVGLVIIDSIATFKPRKILEESTDSHNIGLHAKGLRSLFTGITGAMSKNKITTIWINQETSNPGGFTGGVAYPGGTAPGFYSSITINCYRGSKEPSKSGIKGEFVNKGWIRVSKNKTAPPYFEGKYDMYHGTGICTSTEVLDYGVECGALYKKGHAYYYDSTFENDVEKKDQHIHIGTGKYASKLALDDNLELRQELYDTILEHYLKTK